MTGSYIGQYLIPIYLILILLIQIDLNFLNIFLICFPISLIIISIYLKNKKVGFIGLYLFYMLSLSTIIIVRIEDFFQIFIEFLLVIIPSLLLIIQVLQFNEEFTFDFETGKKPILISLFVPILIFIIFYLITVFLFDGLLLFTENIEAQILVFISIICIFCFPFIFTKDIKNKKKV